MNISVERFLEDAREKMAPHYMHHRKSVRCVTKREYFKAHSYINLKVRKTYLKGFEISTVHLAFDHGMMNDSLFFETMVFTDKDHKLSDYCVRAHNHRAALKNHRAVVAMVKRYIKEDS